MSLEKLPGKDTSEEVSEEGRKIYKAEANEKKEGPESVFSIKLGMNTVDILKTGEYSGIGIGYETEAEDSSIVRLADAGSTIALSIKRDLESSALEAFRQSGELTTESAGLEGFTSERVERFTDTWNGPKRVYHDGHVFDVVKDSVNIPIQGAGNKSVTDVRLQLVPSALRNGKRIIYE